MKTLFFGSKSSFIVQEGKIDTQIFIIEENHLEWLYCLNFDDCYSHNKQPCPQNGTAKYEKWSSHEDESVW